MRKKFTYFNLSKPYVQQCPLIVQAACILADAKACWQTAGEACFRSVCSCYQAKACLNGCPFSRAHNTFAAVASDQLKAWSSISLYGFLKSYLDLQLYDFKRFCGTFLSFLLYLPFPCDWRFSVFSLDQGLNFGQSHLKNVISSICHKSFLSQKVRIFLSFIYLYFWSWC